MPPGLRLLQSLPLQHNSSNSNSNSSSFSGSVAWSQVGDDLAVAASDAVLTVQTVPDPRSDLAALNLRLGRAAAAEEAAYGPNPYLDDVDSNCENLLENLPNDVRGRLSAMGCLRRSPPEGSRPPRRRIGDVGWMATKGSPAIITLTEDHWLRAFGKCGEETTLVQDFSENLNLYLKGSKWKDSDGCNMFPEVEKRFQKQLNCHAGRVFLQSMTCFKCIGNSALIAGTKSGHLVLWRIDNAKANVDSVIDCQIGSVQMLEELRMSGEERRFVFVGSLDGRVKLFELDPTSGRVTDLGFCWDKEDMVEASAVHVTKGSKLPTLDVILAKGSFLVALQMNLEGKSGLTVSKRASLGPVQSAIIDVVPWNESPSYLIFTQTGKPRLASLVVDDKAFKLSLADLEGALPAELDSEAYRTVSAAASEDGSTLAVVQTVCGPHDHLVMRNPGRLLLLAPSEDLVKVATDCFAESRRGALLKNKLEVLRLTARRELLSESHGDSDSATLDSMADMIRQHRKTSSSRTLCLWMSDMMLQIAEELEDENRREEFQSLAKDLTSELLADRAKSLLGLTATGRANRAKKPKLESRDDDGLSGAATFLLRTMQKDVKAIKHITQLNIPRHHWSCKMCGKDAEEWELNRVRCSSGHTWPICVRTFRVCDDPDPDHAALSCQWCGASCLPCASVDHVTREPCVLCGGPFVVPQ